MKAKAGTRQNRKPEGDHKVYVIGITGAIGAGKSEIVKYIKEHYRCRIFLTDEIAQEVSAPGGMAYSRLRELLPKDAFDKKTGCMDRVRTAELMYADPTLRERMNDVIHPAVGIYLGAEIEQEKRKGRMDFLIIESALYDGDGFALLCREVWNVSAPEEVRLRRLMESRGYSEEKARSIFESQRKYDKMRARLGVQIDNGGDLAHAYAQVDRELTRLLPDSRRL